MCQKLYPNDWLRCLLTFHVSTCIYKVDKGIRKLMGGWDVMIIKLFLYIHAPSTRETEAHYFAFWSQPHTWQISKWYNFAVLDQLILYPVAYIGIHSWVCFDIMVQIQGDQNNEIINNQSFGFAMVCLPDCHSIPIQVAGTQELCLSSSVVRVWPASLYKWKSDLCKHHF